MRRAGPPGSDPALARLFLLASLAGCAEPAAPVDPAEVAELLSRAPDALNEQPGALIPGEDGWGEDGAGWEEASAELVDDEPLVWAVQTPASLELHAGMPCDRALEFTALGPRWRPGIVKVELNGIALEELELSREPSRHSLHAPEHAWRYGKNRLAFTTALCAREEDGAQVAFALGRLDYDVPRLVELDPDHGRATLRAGNSLCYRIRPRGRVQLLVGGRASSKGSVTFTRRWIDAASGHPLGPPATTSFECGDHPFLRGLQLDEPAGRMLEVRILWRSDGDSKLTLTKLELQDLSQAAKL